jgi:hypothetical protein
MSEATDIIIGQLRALDGKIDVLLLLLDRGISFLNSVLPPTGTAVPKTPSKSVEDNYKIFYTFKGTLLQIISSIVTDPVTLALMNKYSLDTINLSDAAKRLSTVSAMDTYAKLDDKTKTDFVTFFTALKSILVKEVKIPLEQQVRSLSGNSVGQTTTDNKQPSNQNVPVLYSAVQTETKNATAQSILNTFATRDAARQKSKDSLNSYLKDWVRLKPVTDILTDPKKLPDVANKLINGVNAVADWFKKYIAPDPSAGTIATSSGLTTSTDQEKRLKFTLSNLLLGKDLVKTYEASEQTQDYIQKYWRERTRKKFGNFPFCDETLVNGQWVPTNEAESQLAVNIAKQQILLKMLKEKP